MERADIAEVFRQFLEQPVRLFPGEASGRFAPPFPPKGAIESRQSKPSSKHDQEIAEVLLNALSSFTRWLEKGPGRNGSHSTTQERRRPPAEAAPGTPAKRRPPGTTESGRPHAMGRPGGASGTKS
eukprot:GHVT01017053.1.p1 GENE.GHVT01017053.1~~GHVT01017053.1.p1  ORF type:complete len:126 (+),score=27.16 GHVT01017053.1:580-957(+)